MAKRDDCLIKTGMTEAEIKAAFPNGIPTGDEAKQFINNRRAFAQMSRKQKALEISAAIRNQDFIKGYVAKGGNVTDAVASLVARDERELGGTVNMESRARAIQNKFHGMMHKTISALETTRGGLKRDKKLGEEMLYEIVGGNSNNTKAKALADEWRAMSDYGSDRLNRAGANIKRIDNWLPQSHAGHKLRAAGKDLAEAKVKWKTYIGARVNQAEMLDELSGKPMTNAELSDFLDATFDKIVSNDTSGSRGILANSYGRQRSIIFKDADSWMQYQKEFGADDLWGVMIDHMRRTSHDISAMETLGPDPDGVMQKLLQDAKKDATKTESKLQQNKISVISQAYRDQRMSASPDNPHHQKPFQLIRNIAMGTILPATAPITAVTTDIASAALANFYSGLPVLRGITSQLKQIWENGKSAKLGGKASRDYLIELGASFDSAIDSAISAQRFAGDVGEFGSKFGNFAMRVSGMNAATMGQRTAWAENTLYVMHRDKGKTFSELDPRVQAMYERNNVTESDWDIARKTKGATPPNSTKVKHMNLQALPDEQNTKFGAMIAAEMEVAVPMPNAINRSRTALGTEAGYWSGELVRTGMQFLSTPVTVTFNQVGRMVNGNGLKNNWGRLGYVGGFIGGMTMAGYVALMITDMTKGREPRMFGGDNTDEQNALLLWDSATKGGANLIAGDVLNVIFSRYGQAELSALPSGAAIELLGGDLIGGLLAGNLANMIKGEETNVISDTVDLVKNAPLINTWYAKEAMNRALWDVIGGETNSSFDKKQRQNDRRRERELNQGLWLER